MRHELFWKILKSFPILVKNSHFAKNVSLLVCQKLDRELLLLSFCGHRINAILTDFAQVYTKP